MRLKLTSFLFLISLCFATTAKAEGLSLISDEETELFLAQILKPLFSKAGIPFNRNNIFIVNDDSLNAFVGDGNAMFINTGTIIKSSSSAEIEGVLAHETGHIIGGHILRMKLKTNELNRMALASMVMAGVAAGASGRGDVAMAIMLGSQSSLLSNYTAYRVEEERSADDAAVMLLGKLHQSPQGILDFMKKIQSQNMLSGVEESTYFRTHPVTSERVTFLTEAVNTSPYKEANPDNDEFLRIKAKLIGYLYPPQKTLQRYPPSDLSIPAKYGRSVAYFKQMKINNAIKEIDDLLVLEPNNPFFHELKGQIFLETGKLKPARAEYTKSLNLLPDSALFQQSLAQVILEDTPKAKDAKEAEILLTKSLIKMPNGYSWLLLSRAYGLQNKTAYANYAAAEYSLRIGAVDIARRQATDAKEQSTSPSLTLKLDDLLTRLNEYDKNSTTRY